jgi:hypothetical protein
MRSTDPKNELEEELILLNCNCPSCGTAFDFIPDARNCLNCGGKVMTTEQKVSRFGSMAEPTPAGEDPIMKITQPDGSFIYAVESPHLMDLLASDTSPEAENLRRLLADEPSDADDDDDFEEDIYYAYDCICGSTSKIGWSILQLFIEKELAYDCDACEKELDPRIGWYPISFNEYMED